MPQSKKAATAKNETSAVADGQVEIAYDDSIIVMSVEIKALWDEWIRRESK